MFFYEGNFSLDGAVFQHYYVAIHTEVTMAGLHRLPSFLTKHHFKSITASTMCPTLNE